MSAIDGSELWEQDRQYKAVWNNFERAKPVLWSFRFSFPNQWNQYDVRTFTIISHDQEIAEQELKALLSRELNVNESEIRTDQRGFISKVHFVDSRNREMIYTSRKRELARKARPIQEVI
jgi:hypothetical protein